ncbi:MAG: endoflagellar basal body-associated protein [Spirochaetes bacterium]|nr:MAG: endoflagellar basal body-associated protein [Spirochaetota bacterium]
MGDEERVNVDEVAGEDQEAAKPEAAAGVRADASRIVKILLYVAGAVLAVFLMVGISYLVNRYLEERRYEKTVDIVTAPPPAPLNYYDIPTFSVTTRDADPHFAKVSLSLGYDDNQALSIELGKRLVQMQHMINIILRSKGYEEFDSVEDILSLAEEIKAHVNTILIAGKIKEVYFKEFIVN